MTGSRFPTHTYPTAAPPVGWERIPRSGFESARRAANHDAMLQLQRRILSLRVTPSQRVSDVAHDNPRFTDALAQPFPGVVFGDPIFQSDATCTVRCVVRLQDVVAHLRDTGRRFGVGPFRQGVFDRIRAYDPTESIIVVGRGVPSLEDIYAPSHPVDTPSWALEKRVFKGRGVEPASLHGTASGKLVAFRLAKNDARAKTIAYVRLLPLSDPAITGIYPQFATVGSECDRRPDLQHAFSGWVDQLHTVDSTWTGRGEAVVVMEADLSTLWRIFTPLPTRRPPRVTRPIPNRH